MFVHVSNILFFGAIILFIGIIVSKFGSKLGVPSLLLFLMIGIFFGEGGLGIRIKNPELVQLIGMISLNIILFSGGMDTKMKDISKVVAPGILLSTLGVMLTALITGTFIFMITKNSETSIVGSFLFCFLLAATMASTDSASVFNVFKERKIGLKYHLKPMLELESGSNDPMAYMLTIALIGLCTTTKDGFDWNVVTRFFIQYIVGLLAGGLLGQATRLIMNKIRLNNISLYPIILICVTFFTFSFTELIHGNGYLAVYVTGLVAGNGKMVHKRECQKFLDGITWFVQIIMFISLGLMVSPQKMAEDALLALATGAFMIFIARPASVFICLAPFRQFNFKAKMLASWVGLRGATPIIFATYPLVAGVEGADQIFNVVFFITLISLMLQGTTIPVVARKLGLLTELPKEGNSFGIEFPEEIQNKLTDWEVHEGMLEHGNLIKNVELPANSLIIMIKRGKEYIMPKGDVALQVGDMLLLMEDASVSTTGAMSIQKALENIQDIDEKTEQQPEVADAAVPIAQPVHTK